MVNQCLGFWSFFSYWMEGSATAAAGWTIPATQQCLQHNLGLRSQYSQPEEETNMNDLK